MGTYNNGKLVLENTVDEYGSAESTLKDSVGNNIASHSQTNGDYHLGVSMAQL